MTNTLECYKFLLCIYFNIQIRKKTLKFALNYFGVYSLTFQVYRDIIFRSKTLTRESKIDLKTILKFSKYCGWNKPLNKSVSMVAEK